MTSGAKTRERQGRYQPDWNPNMDNQKTLRCGTCLGTGTMARYHEDGSIDPVDCDTCHGFGYAVVDAHSVVRDPMGRFSGV